MGCVSAISILTVKKLARFTNFSKFVPLGSFPLRNTGSSIVKKMRLDELYPTHLVWSSGYLPLKSYKRNTNDFRENAEKSNFP
jgi:hypothetical protein